MVFSDINHRFIVDFFIYILEFKKARDCVRFKIRQRHTLRNKIILVAVSADDVSLCQLSKHIVK